MVASRANPRPTVNFDYRLKEQRERADKGSFWCGQGAIGFDVVSVRTELITTLDTTLGASAGIKTPIITLSGGTKEEAVNAQTLDYNLWPQPWSEQPEEFRVQKYEPGEIEKAPIAKVLLSLRDALILSALKYEYPLAPNKLRPPQPCFLDYDPEKPGADAGHFFKIALTFINDPSVGISVALATPISPTFSLSGESKTTTGNSITVSFAQQGVAVLQAKKDAVEKACAEPVRDPKRCAKAKDEYQKAKDANAGLGQSITIQ